MKISFVGCGNIGEKRAKSLGKNELVGVFDTNPTRMQALAQKLRCAYYNSYDEMIRKSGTEIVVIATTNSSLCPMALRAVEAGVHVLVEKPAGINVVDLYELRDAAAHKKVAVKVGFNHRFHPALLKAKELIDKKALGDLMFMRARYGHGARVGYDKEWRALPEMAGGGELIDQGVHILDLIYWFFGPMPLQSSLVTTNFWNMKVDDNAVLTLKKDKQWATFHVSCTEWKNTFGLEIYGKTGKIAINGLGRSYGKETLHYYKMLPQMGPPETQAFEFDEEDFSWKLDLDNLVDHISKKTPLLGDLHSAIYALEQVREAYRQNGFTDLPCSV